MNKKLVSSLFALGIVISNTGFICANEESETDSLNLNYATEVTQVSDDLMEVKLDQAKLALPYNKDDVTIDRKDFENKVEFVVTDKSTGEILSVFGEEILKTEKNVFLREAGAIGTRQSRNLYAEFSKGPCTVRLNQPITIWASGSFRAISGAGKATLNQVTGGNWSLSGISLRNNWKGGQANSIRTDAMATITVKTSSTTVGAFNPDRLKKAGFNVKHSGGVNYVARYTPTNRYGFVWDIYSGYTTFK